MTVARPYRIAARRHHSLGFVEDQVDESLGGADPHPVHPDGRADVGLGAELTGPGPPFSVTRPSCMKRSADRPRGDDPPPRQ
jgi:hypothetical protein